MQVLIVGSGINGALAGAALIEAGADVRFVVRPSRQRQLISTGVHITSPLGRFRKPVHAIVPAKRLGDALDVNGPVDVLILATRANVYQPGLFVTRDVVSPATMILPLFDGVHHLDHWRECYPNNPVALVRFDARATLDADGIVRQSAPAGDLKLGPLSASGAERLEALCCALDGRRFCAYPHGATALTDVWARAIFRAAAAGASQLSRTPLRDTLRFVSRKPFLDMMEEGVRIGEARRIPGVRDAAARYKTAFMKEGEPVIAPVPIAAGGRAGSEAQFLLGNMLRQAQDAGVPVPWLLKAWAAASKIETSSDVATTHRYGQASTAR